MSKHSDLKIEMTNFKIQKGNYNLESVLNYEKIRTSASYMIRQVLRVQVITSAYYFCLQTYHNVYLNKTKQN